MDLAPVFEYWAHAAAYLPWRDFRYTLPRKARIKANGHDWFRVDKAEVDRVLARLRAEGPLMARHFDAVKRNVGWWDWKPAKRALEFLFMAGELMVVRQGFQKVFDLTERVLLKDTDTRHPTPTEQALWYVNRTLDAWGLAARDEFGYQRKEFTEEIDTALRDLEEDGQLSRVWVDGIPKKIYWVRSTDLEKVDALDAPNTANRVLRILSPFDPLVIHRKRISRLFGFDLALECYLPVEKRTFGYFALPLFQGGAFVGLLDAKADRIAGSLSIRNLRYVGSARRRISFDRGLEKALVEFAAFNRVRLSIPDPLQRWSL